MSTAFGVTEFLNFLCNLRIRNLSACDKTPVEQQMVHDSMSLLLCSYLTDQPTWFLIIVVFVVIVVVIIIVVIIVIAVIFVVVYL